MRMPTKILALTALALTAAPSALAAAGGCHAISGAYINHGVPCTVPALACVESELTGDFSGTATTIVATFDPATNIYSGTVTNVLDNGAVFYGAIGGTIVNGTGHSLEVITGGTRQFAHAFGFI